MSRLLSGLKEPSYGILSYFGHVQNYLEIEGNLKIIVYYDRTVLKDVRAKIFHSITILVLFLEVGLLRKQFPILPTFSQNLIFQKAFETVAPMNEELKRTEFHRAICKKFKLLVDRFSSFYH